MNRLAKVTSIALMFMLVAVFMSVKAYAFVTEEADYFDVEGSHEYDENNKPVWVAANNRQVTVTGGDKAINTSQIVDINSSITVEVKNGGTADVTTGNITNQGGIGLYVTNENGTAFVNVDGSVEGHGQDTTLIRSDNGNSTVIITGDATNETKAGVGAFAYNGGTTNVTVNGDVISQGSSALEVGNENNNKDSGFVEVTVEGTITGETVGVRLFGNDTAIENVSVTAWAITPVNGMVAGSKVNGSIQQNEDFEKKINYIIRLEQPAEVNAFKAIDGNNKTVNNGDTRNEGTEIRLEALPGFEITGAFNGKGEKMPLEYKEGHYYIKVPKGGGVYLTVTVGPAAGKILNPQATNGESLNNANGASLCASIAQMITGAAQGDTVRVTIPSGSSLCKMAVDALEARPDVTLIVDYAYNGGMYEATIPGGDSRPDLKQYKNAAGGIDFETLTVHFGGKQIF